jgi:hypothetical protein
MNQALILVNHPSGLELTRDPEFAPSAMTDVWYATAESPLPARAKLLSQGHATLAAMEWAGEVLKLWAFQDGALKFEYDASPSAMTCTITPPTSSGEGDLGALFGVPDRSAAINKLLSRKKGLGFISESQRLEQLLALLGVPVATASSL